jgi:sec-independent protein translocase protein TatA
MFRNPLTDGIIVLVILILFFGPKRLPLLGRSIGEGIKEFKHGITSKSTSDEDDTPQLTAQAETPAPPPPVVESGSERS